jgi:TonB family protein
MSTNGILPLVLICVFSATTATADQNLGSILTDQYRDQVLALRHSFKSKKQEYGADGVPTRTSEEGPWTLYGRMAVKKISVNAEQLKVEGKRALYIFDSAGNQAQFKDDREHPAESLTVTVRLEQPLSSSDVAAALLGRVFALTPEAVLDSAPVYWRAPLAKQFGVEALRKQAQNADGTETPDSDSEKVWTLAEYLNDKTHFRAPKPVYHVEPAFTEAARSRKFQGVVALNVVVDRAGKVADVRIVRPLGMGLDDSAVATVSTLRFQPATKDGQPVAVVVFIEIDFHLF